MRYTTSGKQVRCVDEGVGWARSEHIADAATPEYATKIAEALNLMEAPPHLVIDRIDQSALDELLEFKPGRMTLVRSPRSPLPESEILTRAREAAIASSDNIGPLYGLENIREGKCDGQVDIIAAIRALRDLAKPLEEIAPAVDPDLIEARKVAAEFPDLGSVYRGELLRGDCDDHVNVVSALAAIRRGRELERALAIEETRAAIEREARSC